MKITHISSIGYLSQIQRTPPKKYPNKHFIKEEQRMKLRIRYETFLKKKVETHSLIWCHSGLNNDIDYIWIRAVLNVRLMHPSVIKLHLHIPHEEYPKNGVKRGLQTTLWVEHLNAADRLTAYTDDKTIDSKDLVNKVKERKTKAQTVFRDINKSMIDASDLIIAIFDHTPIARKINGLRYALEYAVSEKKEILRFIPKNF